MAVRAKSSAALDFLGKATFQPISCDHGRKCAAVARIERKSGTDETVGKPHAGRRRPGVKKLQAKIDSVAASEKASVHSRRNRHGQGNRSTAIHDVRSGRSPFVIELCGGARRTNRIGLSGTKKGAFTGAGRATRENLNKRKGETAISRRNWRHAVAHASETIACAGRRKWRGWEAISRQK